MRIYESLGALQSIETAKKEESKEPALKRKATTASQRARSAAIKQA